jgi:hypothetical protein
LERDRKTEQRSNHLDVACSIEAVSILLGKQSGFAGLFGFEDFPTSML